MTILADQAVQFREFPGWQDPSLPLGYWAAVSVVTGDASGGSRINDLIFAPASQPRTSTFYSLEQYSLFDEDANDKVCQLQSVALDFVGKQDFGMLWAHRMQAAPDNAMGLGADMNVPLWLGRQQDRDVNTFLRALIVNVDLNDFIFSAGGYFWGSRSLNAPGGPQRPTNGLYRA